MAWLGKVNQEKRAAQDLGMRVTFWAERSWALECCLEGGRQVWVGKSLDFLDSLPYGERHNQERAKPGEDR